MISQLRHPSARRKCDGDVKGKNRIYHTFIARNKKKGKRPFSSLLYIPFYDGL